MTTFRTRSWLACASIVALTAACASGDSSSHDRAQASGDRAGGSASETAPAQRVASSATTARGKAVYDAQCAVCHGALGRGDGTAAYLLSPKPRDFASGRFRLVSTDNGVPSDADLVTTLRRGMPGSAMPPWDWLCGADLESVALYVRELAVTGKAAVLLAKAQADEEELTQAEALDLATEQLKPGAPLALGSDAEADAKSLAHGRQLFVRTCALCHGLDGRARDVKDQRNEDGTPNQPRDLTLGVLKGGTSERDIACRIRAGLPGSPMPATTSYTDEELRALAAYVRTLIPPGAEALERQTRRVVRVARARAELPTRPADAAWTDAPESYVGLMPLWWRNARAGGVRMRALHDGRRLAVRLTWEDATRDEEILGQSVFTDAVALQLSADADAPLFTMGSVGSPVNIWQWKAAWEKDLQSVRDVVDRYPNTPDDLHGYVAAEDAAMYLTARAVGNGQAVAQRASPCESLRAEGFGTLAPLVHGAALGAAGTWSEGYWDVVFVRALPAQAPGEIAFAAGERAYFAIGAWDGSAQDRNGQKSVSVWHVLALDP